MVRHYHGRGPGGGRKPRVLGVHDALDDEFARPDGVEPVDVVPAQRRAEPVGDPLGQRLQPLLAGQVPGEVAEAASSPPKDAIGPARSARPVDQVAEIQRWRHRKPVLDVGMPLPCDLKAQGQRQGAAPGGDGALHQRPGEAAVLHHIKLEPERPVHRLGHVLDGADGQRPQRVGHARRRGRAGRQDLAVAVLHPPDATGRKGDGQRHPLVQHHR
jgi:hypothetical protein